MVARSMYIGPPKMWLKEDSGWISGLRTRHSLANYILTIEFEYGEVMQEDGHAPKDEELDFARCLIRNLQWELVANFLKENNIKNIVEPSGSGFVVSQTNIQNPDAFYKSHLKKVVMTISFATDDPFKAAATQLKNKFCAITLKQAIADEDMYKYSSLLNELESL